MRSFEYKQVVSAADTAVTVASLIQPSRPAAGPIPFYPGQDLDPLFRLIPHLRNGMPQVELRIGLVEDATVFVQSGYDGVVVDAMARVVKETCYYSNIWQQQALSGSIETEAPEYDLASLFVGFDAAWFIYYHWMCFALGVSGIARSALDWDIPIGFPSYDDRLAVHPANFSRTVWEQSMARFVPTERVRLLPAGQYKVRKAYVVYVAGSQNTDMTMHRMFNVAFQAAAQAGGPGGAPGRIFISRLQQGANGRITAEEDTLFTAISARHGFTKVFLEDLAFDEQVKLFSTAEAVLAPHGSGLSNMLFARPGTKLIELSRDVDRNGTLRPWFYTIAEGARQPYAVLNGDAGDFTPERIAACFDAMGL